MKMKTNIILQGDALTKLKEIPDESINCLMTSPPYWALRDYGTDVETIWDENLPKKNDGFIEGWNKVINKCEHEWIKGKCAGDTRISKRSESRAGWERPSREEFANRTVTNTCPVCKKKFEGKPNQKFCSTKCLNTLSNAERTSTQQTSNFCQKCGAWKGQLGLEPTFDLYIKHLCDIFDEVKRVLRKDGTCWVNLGDTYYGGGKDGKYCKKGISDIQLGNKGSLGVVGSKFKSGNYKDKCLTMIPQRFAIEMVNRGWILRNNIIWHKPNCMPSSVKDRFTVDFEYVFFFVKNKKYWFETQYEPIAESTKNDSRFNNENYNPKEIKNYDTNFQQSPASIRKSVFRNKDIINRGRNKRTVWQICPQPFGEGVCLVCGHYDKPKGKVEKRGYFGGEDKSKSVCKACGSPLTTSHFAIYPEELCEIPIKSGCPEFVCKKCGKPKVLEIEREGKSSLELMKGKDKSHFNSEQGQKENIRAPKEAFERKIINKGYKPTCECNVSFTSGIVLDPFFGAGTTGLVALKQGKKFIGIELNKEYIKIAKARIKPFLEQTKL